MKQIRSVFTILLGLLSLLNGYAQTDSLYQTPEPDGIDLFGFQVEEKSWFKIGLLQLISNFSENGFSGELAFGYEYKVNTSWSINGEVAAPYFYDFRPMSNQRLRIGEAGIMVALSPRYYYNLKRRMAAERSVDNLSANYVTISVGTRLMKTEPGWTAPDNVRYFYSNNIALSPLLGMQRRIFKDGFLDFSVGFKMAYGDPQRSPIIFPRGAEKFWQIYPVTHLRAGLAF